MNIPINNEETKTDNNDQTTSTTDDWRIRVLDRVREVIMKSDANITEELKWAKPSKPGVPVWSYAGIICTGEIYKEVVKLTFAKGAFLLDPDNLFNSSLEGNTRRAIDIHEGDEINQAALTKLVKNAVDLNQAAGK